MPERTQTNPVRNRRKTTGTIADRQADVSVIGHELSLVETSPVGYDPYDKAGPRPSDQQLEARFGVARKGKKTR